MNKQYLYFENVINTFFGLYVAEFGFTDQSDFSEILNLRFWIIRTVNNFNSKTAKYLPIQT